jgi:CrcB protein
MAWATTSWATTLGIFTGAGLGALLRHALNLRLNPLLPALPLGTLAANLLGGYLVGLVAGVLLYKLQLASELRPLLITGFLGGLTTFSAFSLELATAIQTGRLGVAAAAVALHVGGSLALTLLGLHSARLLAG